MMSSNGALGFPYPPSTSPPSTTSARSSMDPDEAAKKLLLQAAFYEVRRKRDRKMEVANPNISRSNCATSCSRCRLYPDLHTPEPMPESLSSKEPYLSSISPVPEIDQSKSRSLDP